ncbi:hypothetical protein H2200_001573 [Cladophialophora chaetospira]|uniref:Uncharacterized protein n=1 Tax=Cladophialophora chaetospira TaxID=386627 RepID=A0AA38XL92_9EURO|nr:hypothetical protein H2200_001573 [Cladophialophora chaetospira]
MGLITFKHAQLLLLVLEARFGPSTLQNYDAIIRDDKFSRQSGSTVRLALLFLFALPLGLSASYKRFTRGRTEVSTSNDQVISFGPTGPPGLLYVSSGLGSGQALFHNATSALFAGRDDIFHDDDAPPSASFGYNMHVINDTATAMLDIPLATNLSAVQSEIPSGVSLTISAHVNATFARLNSTPATPERQEHDYWDRIAGRLDQFGMSTSWQANGLGQGTWVAMWSSWIDGSLIFTSYWDTKVNETVESQALGFDIYRGTARGTWHITRDSIALIAANEFQTDFSPLTRHPQPPAGQSCNLSAVAYSPQKVIFCQWTSVGAYYNKPASGYLLGRFDNAAHTFHPSPVSVWVSLVAAAAWAEVASSFGSKLDYKPQLQYLIHTPPYDVTTIIPTLKRHWGLYTILAVQPCLLLIILTLRYFLRSTPMSDNFGLITLLAGADRDSLLLLKGASYSGKVKEPVKVLITDTTSSYTTDMSLFAQREILYTFSTPERSRKSDEDDTYLKRRGGSEKGPAESSYLVLQSSHEIRIPRIIERYLPVPLLEATVTEAENFVQEPSSACASQYLLGLDKMVYEPETYYLKPNEHCPNNERPVLIYRDCLPVPLSEEKTTEFLESHAWEKKGVWGHIAYKHFHPNTHECYGTYRSP